MKLTRILPGHPGTTHSHFLLKPMELREKEDHPPFWSHETAIVEGVPHPVGDIYQPSSYKPLTTFGPPKPWNMKVLGHPKYGL